eukprot:2277025-Pyramimonas_sp.AAC.1
MRVLLCDWAAGSAGRWRPMLARAPAADSAPQRRGPGAPLVFFPYKDRADTVFHAWALGGSTRSGQPYMLTRLQPKAGRGCAAIARLHGP